MTPCMLATPCSVDRNGRRARAELVIPDNHLPAVSRAHRYEPDTNPTCHTWPATTGSWCSPHAPESPGTRRRSEWEFARTMSPEPNAYSMPEVSAAALPQRSTLQQTSRPSWRPPGQDAAFPPDALSSVVWRRSTDAERQRDAPNSTGCETPGADTGQRGADHIMRYRSVGAAWSPATGIPPLSTTFRATPIQSGVTRAPQGGRARHPCSGRYERPPRGVV